MECMKVSLSKTSTISLLTTEKPKIVITKDETVPAGEKSILKKTQVSLSLEEYNLLKVSLPAIDSLVNYHACAKQYCS